VRLVCVGGGGRLGARARGGEDLGAFGVEILEPSGHDSGRDIVSLTVFVYRRAPVETDVAVGYLTRTVDERVELLDPAIERRRFLDDQRLADVVHRQSRQCLVNFARFGIEVYADEIEIVFRSRGVEKRFSFWERVGPGYHPYRHQVPVVVLANGRDEFGDPGCRYLFS